jgi:hypothetical protein
MTKQKSSPLKLIIILGALVGGGLLIALIALLISLTGTLGGNITGTDITPVKNSSRERIEVSQAYLSGMVGRVVDRNSELYYYLTPKLNFRVDDDIDSPVSKVEIFNIKLNNYPDGAVVKSLAPNHVNPYQDNIDPYFNVNMLDFDFNFDSLESKTKIEYKVTDGAYTQYIDDFAKSGDFLEFLILVYKAGNFNEDMIINRDRMLDSSKYLQYAEVTADKITAELSFIVQITFENGESTYKEFKFQINGEEMVNTGFINYDPKIDGERF